MKVSSKVMGVEYAIRDIVAEAQRLEAAGRSVTYLNIGDPPWYGFHAPRAVLEELSRSALSGHAHYAPSEGLAELRAEIAKKEAAKGLDCGAEDILVTNGVSEALDMVISSIVEDGDEGLLPGPYYPPYASYIRLHGGVPVEFATDAESSTPDIADIRSKVTGRTVAICLINPNNPSGTVYGKGALAEIVDIAAERGLYVICDEIYDEIVFDGGFDGIGSVARDAAVIVLNGFSKVHLMSGLRAGYMAFSRARGLDAIREHLPKLARVRIATCLPVQHAALASLREPHAYVDDFVSELKKRRDAVVRGLNSVPGLSCPVPRGAFYAFPRIEDARFADDRKFVLGLLESKGVLTVHGSGFGSRYGAGHFRVVFLAPVETLEGAVEAIRSYMS
ncbi:MAG: aminotransferase class I/II-fold pyridoxal phosphate-dependent enzyme [Thaumarchaeota archaeon]|nr:aminotransferase class I/II-fold pyridoxal phosphate-dependent enzyme [Nitrososphaerota archaeon]